MGAVSSVGARLRGRDTAGVLTTLVLAAVVVGCGYAPWLDGPDASVSGVTLTARGIDVVAAGIAAGLLAFLFTVKRWPALWLAIGLAGGAAEVVAYREHSRVSALGSPYQAAWGLDLAVVAPALLMATAVCFGALGPDRRLSVRGLRRLGFRLPRVGLSRRRVPPLVPNEVLARVLADVALFVQREDPEA